MMMKSPSDVDWHNLAKKLQAALEKQLDENQQLEEEIEQMNEDIEELHQIIEDQRAVIEYLEKRNGNDSI
jgi:TolA-binding protein